MRTVLAVMGLLVTALTLDEAFAKNLDLIALRRRLVTSR